MVKDIKASRFRGIKFLLLFLLCSLFIVHFSFASEVPRFYGEEVVVTAARLPLPASKSPWNTSVISSTEVHNFKTVGEALRTVAGVDSQSYGYLGSLNSVRLRGANASQVLILVDGRRINSPTLGMFDMGDLLTDNVERIEVVRAPLSAVYGSDAISGVINIISKTPKEGDKAISAQAASFGTGQYKVSLSGANYSLNADYLQSNGFRQNGDYLAKNVAGKIVFPTKLGELIADVQYYDAIKGVPGVPTSDADPYSATEPNDRQSDKNTLWGVGLKGDNYLLRLHQSNLDQKLDPYIFGASTNLAAQTGVEWQQNIGSWLYGLEVREDKGKTTMSGDHTISNYAAFLQDVVDLNDQLSLTASIRGDHHSTAGSAVNPRLGVVIRMDKATIFRASAGTAFRAPTLNELYWNDGWMFGDPTLKPEKSLSYELGLERQLTDRTDVRLSYYNSRITDLILWDWQSSAVATTAKNIGEVRSEGVEFELNRKIGEDGRGYINYTYQKAVDQQDFDPLAVGKTLRYTPQNKFNAGIVMGGSSVIVKYVGERYADLYNTVKLPAYTVVDLKLSKAIAGFTVDLAVDNLFNENYSEAVGSDPTTWASRNYPMPGRCYSLGVKWGF
ncbi:MAG: TonB-dependent receptor [Candidatus Margulisbacteria bacterium]|nr:TonB-dependent receptor [Candidatus Margulisiibacteriota bacterium]